MTKVIISQWAEYLAQLAPLETVSTGLGSEGAKIFWERVGWTVAGETVVRATEGELAVGARVGLGDLGMSVGIPVVITTDGAITGARVGVNVLGTPGEGGGVGASVTM